eukprot:4365601-Prymnesium_polylepis.3
MVPQARYPASLAAQASTRAPGAPERAGATPDARASLHAALTPAHAPSGGSRRVRRWRRPGSCCWLRCCRQRGG